MSITLEGVPASITREDYCNLIRSIGIDPTRLKSMTWGPRTITAEVDALNANGQYIIERRDDGQDHMAMHHVVINVVDES